MDPKARAARRWFTAVAMMSVLVSASSWAGFGTTVALAQPSAVDPAQYQVADQGYFFVSPSGSFHCGITPYDNGRPTAGCQGPVIAIASHQGNCPPPNPNPSEWGVVVGPSGARYECMNQGFFANGQRVLNYGTSLSVNGYTCTARPTGITCVNNNSGHGFTIARETDTLF